MLSSEEWIALLQLLWLWIKFLFFVLNNSQVHSYLWSSTEPSHTLSCYCTTARYTYTIGQPIHIFIYYEWLPSTLIALVRHYIFSYYTIPALLPGTHIPLVSHNIFSYTILFQHYCKVHSYPWSHYLEHYSVPALLQGTLIPLVTLSRTLFCSSTTARYTHTLGHPQHYFILYPVLEHTIQLLLCLHPLSLSLQNPCLYSAQ